MSSGVWIPLRERAHWSIVRRCALLCVAVVASVFIVQASSPWEVAHPAWPFVNYVLLCVGFTAVWLLTQAAPWDWVRVLSTLIALIPLPFLLLGLVLFGVSDDCRCREEVEVIGRVDGTSVEVRESYDVGWDGRLLGRSLVLARYWGPFVREETIPARSFGDVHLTGNELRYCELVSTGSSDSNLFGTEGVVVSMTFDPVTLDHVSQPTGSPC